MIEVLTKSQEKVLGVKISGKLTALEYKYVLIPRIESIIKEYGRARLLVYMDDDFQGWELEAMWDDIIFGFGHRKGFEKVALIGGKKWIDWGMELSAHLMEGEVKTYQTDRLQDAWHWIKT